MTLRRHGPARAAVGGLLGALSPHARPGRHAFLCREFHSPTFTWGVITEHRNVGQEGLPSPIPSFSVPVRWGGGLWSPPREILVTPPGDRATDTGMREAGEGFCGASGSCERPRLRDSGPQEPGPGVKPSVSPWRLAPPQGQTCAGPWLQGHRETVRGKVGSDAFSVFYRHLLQSGRGA